MDSGIAMDDVWISTSTKLATNATHHLCRWMRTVMSMESRLRVVGLGIHSDVSSSKAGKPRELWLDPGPGSTLARPLGVFQMSTRAGDWSSCRLPLPWPGCDLWTHHKPAVAPCRRSLNP